MALVSDATTATALIGEGFSSETLLSHNTKEKTSVREGATKKMTMITDDIMAAQTKTLTGENTTQSKSCIIDSFNGTLNFENLSLMHSSNEDVSSKAALINEDIKKAALVTKDGTMGTTKVRFKGRGSVVFHQSEIIPSKVEDGLYLGSVLAARNKEGLQELNITHILNVSHVVSPLYPKDFTYKTIKVVDTPNTNIAQHFGECFKFIEEAKSVGRGVLVHCNEGISKSPEIVIAYLMKKHEMSLKAALGQVKTTRSIVQPNRAIILKLLNLQNPHKGSGLIPLVTKNTTEATTPSDNIPTRIEKGLYLGSRAAARNKDGLKKLNITHILTVRMSTRPAYPDDFTYKIIEIPDTEDINIAQYFQECYEYIEEARSMGGGVLVHCRMGISRSASIVIAYLMKEHHGRSFKSTLDDVRTKRPIVNPNSGFFSQLQQYEKSLIRR